MGEDGQRYVGAFLLLVVVWIGVFWWWEPERDDAVAFELPAAETLRDVGSEPRPVERVPVEPEPDAGLAGGRTVEDVPEPALMVEGAGRPETDDVSSDGDAPGPGGVLPPEFRDVVIRRGDTFASIARRELGSSRLAGVVARSNPLKDPRRLRVGETVRVPVDPGNIQGRPVDGAEGDGDAVATPMIEYTVSRGDTLGGIARRFYGSSRYASVIFEANRDSLRSMDTVRLGQVLRIPPASEVTGAD